MTWELRPVSGLRYRVWLVQLRPASNEESRAQGRRWVWTLSSCRSSCWTQCSRKRANAAWSPAGVQKMIFSCFLSFRLGLCSSGPIAYVVMENFWRDGRRERNSHTALGNISGRFFCVKVKRCRRRKGLPAKDTYAPEEGLERKARWCAQGLKIAAVGVCWAPSQRAITEVRRARGVSASQWG